MAFPSCSKMSVQVAHSDLPGWIPKEPDANKYRADLLTDHCKTPKIIDVSVTTKYPAYRSTYYKNTRTHQPDSLTHRYHSPPSIHPSPPLIKGLSWTFLVGSPQVIEKREKGKHTTKDSPFHPINSSLRNRISRRNRSRIQQLPLRSQEIFTRNLPHKF